MSLSAEQRARITRAKLTALVRDAGAPVAEAVDVGSAAALVVDDRAAVLVGNGSAGALAGAMLWARRNGATSLTVFVDDAADDVARWAGYFHLGGIGIEVRSVDDSTSHAATPSPLPTAIASPDVPDDLVATLEQSGVEVVTEWGVVRGEVLGLEVARLVIWPAETGGDGCYHLEAGVGRFDRDAVAATRGDEVPSVSLARTLEQVRAHRYRGAPVHPLQLLARERWLRADVVADPSSVGAALLRPVEMTTEAEGLKDAHPAAALGTDSHGSSLLVVCSRGVDLSLVPLAADTLAMHDPSARLVLALPGVDHHAATKVLVDMLRDGAEIVDVAVGWG